MDFQRPIDRRAASMPLLALESLPCGCVAGVYHVPPGVGALTLFEAKGPYCVFSRHRTGRLASLSPAGDPLVNAEEPFI
jgi:hypothetical protein